MTGTVMGGSIIAGPQNRTAAEGRGNHPRLASTPKARRAEISVEARSKKIQAPSGATSSASAEITSATSAYTGHPDLQAVVWVPWVDSHPAHKRSDLSFRRRAARTASYTLRMDRGEFFDPPLVVQVPQISGMYRLLNTFIRPVCGL